MGNTALEAVLMPCLLSLSYLYPHARRTYNPTPLAPTCTQPHLSSSPHATIHAPELPPPHPPAFLSLFLALWIGLEI